MNIRSVLSPLRIIRVGRKLRGYHLRTAVITFALASGPASPCQQPPDPALTLERARERLLADLDRMPRYTCVQTITRKYYDAPSHIQHPACATLIKWHQERKHELSALGWDRMRLEVAIVEGANVYSWVGAPRFDDATLDKLADHGPLGSGDFGILLSEVLRKTTKITLSFQQEVFVGDRRLFQYSYTIPLEESRYQIKTSNGWAFTAYRGTVLLDTEAADIVRLTVRTPELPADSTGCQAISEVDYGRTSIHDRMVLVPRETRLLSLERAGNETASVTSYASCREYASTVRMLWDDPPGDDQPAYAPSRLEEPPPPLPAGLHLNWRLVTPIDSDTAAAGDPIEAVLRSPIRNKQHVFAPAGAHLHGRLRRVQQRPDPSDHFEIALQFESVEIAGKNVPLTATSFSARPRFYAFQKQPISDDPPDVVTFFFNTQHLRLKQLDEEWITISPNTGKDKK